MTLFVLSWKNIRRNMNRSLVAVFGMAVAAALLTGTTAMSTGYPVEAFISHRSFMQGDIVVYPQKFTFMASDAPGAADADAALWVFSAGDGLNRTDVLQYHPEIAKGYLATAGGIDPIPEETIVKMQGIEGVKAAHPLRLIPCVIQYVEQGSVKSVATHLRGRDISADTAWEFNKYLMGGRAFSPSDGGRMVAMASTTLPNKRQIMNRALPVKVLLPRVNQVGGKTIYDFSEPTSVEFQLIAHFAVPTWVEIQRSKESPEAPSRIVNIQHYWETDQLLVPSGTLDAVFRQIGGTGRPPAYQVGLQVLSMFDVKTVAKRAGETFRQYSAITVPEEAANQERLSGQMSVPADLNSLFRALAYAAAGLLVMANMHVLTVQRAKEIGVLKAIGASTTQIFAIILMEATGFSLFGGLLGFAGVRGVFSLVMLFTDAGLFSASLLTVESLGRVLGVTVGVAILSGLAPAYYAAFRTTTEVLRNDA